MLGANGDGGRMRAGKDFLGDREWLSRGELGGWQRDIRPAGLLLP